MEQKINRITDIFLRDDGISGAMMYSEQISWILFLRFIKLSGIDRAILKEAFVSDGTSAREGYFELQREIYK